VKISATYRLIASVLSMSILIGVSIPSGLHAMSEDVCNDMQEMHLPMNEHAEDCPMNDGTPHQQKADGKHHDLHDLGFACACSVEEAPVKTEAQTQLKVKVPALMVVHTLEHLHFNESETKPFQIPVSDAYSPPPIYLLNETFLK
jgi:hypothetical protein